MGLREKIWITVEKKKKNRTEQNKTKQKYNDFKSVNCNHEQNCKKEKKEEKGERKITKANVPHDSKHSMFYDWIHWAQKYRTLLCTSSIKISSLNSKIKTW